MSVAIHVLGTVVLSMVVSPPQKPVFADPIYSVAFYEAETPTPAPPRRVQRRVEEKPRESEVKPEPEPVVKKVSPVETPVKKTEKPKPEPKKTTEPPVKPPLKAPVKREEAADRVTNQVEDTGDVSLGLVDEKDFRHNYYLERIRALLAAKWRAPGGKEGVQKVTVHFFIDRDGGIRGVEVREGSGAATYDRAALGTVHAVGRFPPLPESYEGGAIGISVVFQTVRGGEE